jgi:hypothetical protein
MSNQQKWLKTDRTHSLLISRALAHPLLSWRGFFVAYYYRFYFSGFGHLPARAAAPSLPA